LAAALDAALATRLQRRRDPTDRGLRPPLQADWKRGRVV